MLGNCYHRGQGVSEDKAEGVKWYRKAADQGNAYGQDRLGDCYANGEGVAEDKVEAAKLYRMAADQGHADAQNNLASCYGNGEGVSENPTDHADEGVGLPRDEIIASAIDEACGTIDDLYLRGAIPEKKLRNAKSACEVPRGENIRLLLDCTVFGSAKYALLIGDRGIYLCNGSNDSNLDGAHFVPWALFLRTDIVELRGWPHDEVAVGGPELGISVSGCSASIDDTIALLITIQRLVRGE